ncbi:MAG TPA: hypothetical protein VKS79_04510 [Gemmataceae bacterium]|nr:hypothetical protein [Gemmataceae bacterium]
MAGRGAILWWFCALTALLSLEFTPNLPAQETVRSPAGQVTARLTELPPATLSKQTPSRPEVLPNPAPGPVMPPPIAPATEPRIAATPEQAPPRVFRIAPRYGNKFQIDTDPEQKAILISGGVLLNIRGTEQSELLDIEADNAVIWTKDDAQQFFQNVQTAQGQTSRDSEFFLSGNVVILTHVGNEDRKIRCEKAYYDTKRSVAVAIGADVEFRDKAFTEALHFRAGEVYQLNANDFKAVRVEIFSSRLPSDPGLKIVFAEATMSQKHTTRTSVLGLPFVNEQTGQVEETTQRIFQGYNGLVELRDVPILYVPYMQGDAANTQGPIKDFAVRHDNIFGYQAYTDWNVFNLLGIDPRFGNSLTLNTDYLSRRGWADGFFWNYTGDQLLGMDGKYTGILKAYGLADHGTDILGGGRGGEHPLWRGRVFWEHQEDLPAGWQVMTQLSLLSDKNFQEQYYKPEFDAAPNQETFLYLKNSQGIWGSSFLVNPYVGQNWMTQTNWLPRADAHLFGWSPWDLFTYNARTSIGYANLLPTAQPPPALLATDGPDTTGRFDFWQDLSLPFQLGAFKVVPFGIIDATTYTNALSGQSLERFYGAVGARASLPLSRLYPDVQSDLFNVKGIYHKMVFSATYYAAWSSVPYNLLPQLDRLNDDATDQALRDITPQQPALNPANGNALATSPLFNPQLLAIRRLVDTNVDTLNTIQVFQIDWRQRFQTKRGYPGNEHTVDWLTLDLSASIFPDPVRDNFGNPISFIEYDATWNVGDRTALVSSGWIDPFDTGTHYFTVGAMLNRPDNTNFYIGYRHTDPLQSRLLVGSASYNFSPKYSITAVGAYDFGQMRGLNYGLVFNRNGTDLQIQLSVSYNPILNNFGWGIQIMPLALVMPQGFNPANGFGYGARQR